MSDWREHFARRTATLKRLGITGGGRIESRDEYEKMIFCQNLANMKRAINDEWWDANAEWVAAGNKPSDRPSSMDSEQLHWMEEAHQQVMAAWPERGDHYGYLNP